MDFDAWAFGIASFLVLPVLLAVRIARRRIGQRRVKISAIAALAAPVLAMSAALLSVLLAHFAGVGVAGGVTLGITFVVAFFLVPFVLAYAASWLALTIMRLPRPAPDPAEAFE